MATPQVKDLVLRSPAGSSEVVTFSWPLQIGHGQDKHDNGIDIIDTIKFVCEELPGISSAFEEVNLNSIDTACYKTMTNLVDRFNKAVDSIVALEKGTSLPTERLNKFADPSLLRHILQLVYNAAVSDPDKLNNYEPFSPEVYGETSYELVQQMIKHVTVNPDDTFIDLGSGVGQVVLQMAGSFPLKTCIGIEKADTPVRYAQRMDLFFRQYMAWFGKRFCEYKLLKGDFLVDEHREKITSSTLVFVNNFAFGPNVDHQLKERFADLRDGARIVSSKSFCPLNFRITDRNLSDIGTIMHLSEIPPLKGSVSWTCKPVSYYLHVIDRTILERYFQRMKSHKGPEHNEHVGSTRTTRDRAKREANHQNNNNNHANSVNNSSNANNSSNSNTPTMNSNSNSTGSTTTATTTTATTTAATTNAQNGKSSTKMDESSTDSETEAVVAGTAPTTNRRTWSDWCSSKGKSSQSDDEENNNFSSTTNSRNNRPATQKRKKLTRKAAIASKSAAAAAAAQAAAEKIAAAAAQKESGNLAAPNTVGGPKRKGRMKKGGGRGKKNLKIVGLDVLHTQTLLSTSAEMMCKKLPPAPGCVDQQLTSLTGDMSHTELDIPQAPSDTPYALQILLDVFRTQYMTLIDNMKSKSFVANLKRQIQQEQERKQRIKNRASQLDKQIKVLIDDSVALLKARMNELGINMSSPNDLLAKAKEIVGRHKELQGMVKKMSSQVTAGEIEQKRLLKKNLQSLPEFAKLSKQKNGTPETFDISEAAAHELLLKEIANTLVQRKKLYAQVSTIEKESITLEKVVEERKTAAALLAQGTNLTIATSTAPTPATTTSATITTTSKSTHTKSSRRSRDHRTRSQEWPDVPDVGKIEESNPEVLAQKILETGRQIEAGKIPSYKHKDERTNKHRSSSNEHNTHHHPQFLAHHSGPDSALMPAPPQGGLKQQQQQQIPIAANHVPLAAGGGRGNNKSSKNHQESPKVANFEDRLKSIITSALNEDQEHRKSQHPPAEAVAAPPPASPAKKHSSKSSANNHHHQQTAQQQMHHHHLSNIITVATQGLTHLNSTTTISPITPPLQQHHYGHSAPTQNGPMHHMHHHSQTMPPSAHSGYKSTGAIPTNLGPSYSKQSTSSSSISSSTSLSAASGSASSSSSAHHQHHQKYPKSIPTSSSSSSSIERAVSIHQLHGHNQHHPMQHQQSSTAHQHAALYAAATDLAFRRGYEHHAHYQEFKAPETMNRGLVEEPARSHSASSDSAMYYPPTRDRLLSLERSQQQQPMQQPSRPSSSSSQPDYTQVSPAKMALRRHLSQEKLANQHVGPTNPSSGSVMASKTIGDLVNGEIERTLEISHQSIINAVVNMSAMTVPPPTAGAGSATTTPSTTERPIINPNAQRPERVHVRVMDEISTQQNHTASIHHQQHHHGHHPYNQISPRTRNDGSMPEKKKSPADNLTTLAQVAYNHKMISKHQQQQPSSSSSAGRPSNAMSYSTPAGYQQHQHSMPPSAGERGTLPHPSPTSSSSSSRNSTSSKRDYSTVALPRAEMKPCLESYFNEEPKTASVAAPLSMKERMANRRMNGNPPLEGLAVSLQDHVMASRKFKEENEERQRRSEMAAAHFQNNSNMANLTSTVPPLTQHHDRTSPIKVEIGMKRTSPSQAHHPRPSKIPHYASHEHLISTNSNTNSSSCSSTNNGRRSNSSLEPPLMSPEINSLMAEERPLQLSSRPRTTDDVNYPDRIVPNYDPRRRCRPPSSPQIGLIVADSSSTPSRNCKS
ncbi:histone-lysine N-methyltransferase, H3 lysine-79 specific isoform X2 [Episyrphus balteatus]|uniref:histone-lysine N-methyltransferase, H3 lysine-79 specific isoform X2 n=1 Tax=Episyrphus balteatus TaxID=286459 RepID=UPI0024856E79|nr:histone-lysine N-methyltransferase, H3 lysine-79 specific isoform X2 [Episyrphus balteatus]